MCEKTLEVSTFKSARRSSPVRKRLFRTGRRRRNVLDDLGGQTWEPAFSRQRYSTDNDPEVAVGKCFRDSNQVREWER